jgi:mRNA-degrading endonuclease RelE of RelBE toxin-antitoxin system
MAYRVLIKRSDEKELAALPAQTKERIDQRLLKLESDPRHEASRNFKDRNPIDCESATIGCFTLLTTKCAR